MFSHTLGLVECRIPTIVRRLSTVSVLTELNCIKPGKDLSEVNPDFLHINQDRSLVVHINLTPIGQTIIMKERHM